MIPVAARAKTIAAIAVAIAAAALLLLAYSHHAVGHASQHVYKLRLGVEFNTHATAAWIALHNHLFQKYGIHVTKLLKFHTGLELASAMVHGEVDAAWACLAPIVKMMDKGLDVYIVQAAHYYGYGCVARPGINSLKELLAKGEPRIAVPGPGTQAHILLLLAMKKYHFKAHIVFIKPPTILEAVEKGEVDAACLPEYFLSVAEARGLKILFTAHDIWLGMPGSYLVVTGKLLHTEPRLVCLLAKVNEEATRFALAHPDEAARIDSEYLGIPLDIAKRSLTRLQLTTVLNVDQMQRLVDLMYSTGVIKHHIDIASRIVNLTKLCGWGGR